MKTVSYSQEKVNEIDWKFVYNVDKLYRMHGGISSHLLTVNSGEAYLKLVISDRWKKSMEETAMQIVKNRLSFDERLKPVLVWKVMVRDYRKTFKGKKKRNQEPEEQIFKIYSSSID